MWKRKKLPFKTVEEINHHDKNQNDNCRRALGMHTSIFC
jgi:hypothetical protein